MASEQMESGGKTISSEASLGDRLWNIHPSPSTDATVAGLSSVTVEMTLLIVASHFLKYLRIHHHFQGGRNAVDPIAVKLLNVELYQVNFV